jgi:small subunit ribosomal protein S1
MYPPESCSAFHRGSCFIRWSDRHFGPPLHKHVRQVTAGARQTAILEITLDDRHPLMTAVLPDNDGVMRARWGTAPAPSDRHWALLTTLRPGQAVTGTVTSISDGGVTSVDIGGVTAMINAPAHPDEPSRSPAVGQQVTATVLHVDTIREQVTLTIRA